MDALNKFKFPGEDIMRSFIYYVGFPKLISYGVSDT